MQGLPLVTGATGFAGSHLVERLLASHRHITCWAHRAPGSAHPERVDWRQVDILDRQAVRHAVRHEQPSVIYHCAGLPHVAESWRHADVALRVNAMGTHHLLEAVEAEAPSCRVVIAGSALVYRPSTGALREDGPIGPADPYGVSKLAQEMIALRADTPVVVARPFNHIGPGQQPSFATASFARQIAEIEAGRSEPRLLVGNLDARRDITDVRDTVRAYEALAAQGRASQLYNVCSGVAYRVGDLLEELLRLATVRIRVEEDPARLRPSDNPLVLGDPSKIASDTGWRPEIGIRQTLTDLLGWWRAKTHDTR